MRLQFSDIPADRGGGMPELPPGFGKAVPFRYLEKHLQGGQTIQGIVLNQ